MTKNKPIYHVEGYKSMEWLRIYWHLCIDLCSERDKSVYFWSSINFIMESLLKKSSIVFFF